MQDELGDLTCSKLEGVSLEQFAGIGAALAEGLPLDEILAQEQVAASSWPAAERAWRQAVVDSTDLQMAYMEKRRIAEDVLFRTADPVDRDPSAWMGLLGAMTLGSSKAVLEKLGLSAVDVARLGRHWRRKAEADPRVAELLTKAAPDAKAPARVSLAAPELRPFPWTPPPRSPNEVASESEAPPSLGPVVEPQRLFASYQIAEKLGSSEQDPDATLAPAARPAVSLPFRDHGAPKPPPSHPLQDQSGETSIGTIRALSPATPFESAASPNAVDVGETAMIVSPFAGSTKAGRPPEPTLPFQGRISDVEAQQRFATPVHDAAPDAGMTMAVALSSLSNESSVDGTVIMPVSGAGAPSSGSRPDGPMSLEEYARMSAALAAQSGDQAEVLRAFGVASLKAKESIDRLFSLRFQTDPRARREYQKLFEAEKTRLEGGAPE